jgi:hypothetical protein
MKSRIQFSFKIVMGHSRSGGTEGMMHTTTDSDGNPNVFNVKRNDDGERWLNTNWTNPNDQWNLDNRIVFRLRNSFHFSSDYYSGEFCFMT